MARWRLTSLVVILTQLMGKSPSATITSFSSAIRKRCRVTAASELDVKDVSLFLDCLVMRLALLYDLAGSQSAVADHWQRTIRSLTTIDVGLYSSDWKTLREIITSLAFINYEGEACASEFKRRAQGRIHYKWILNSTAELWEETRDFKSINQWVVFDSKVNLLSLDLTTACCQEYLDFEASLGKDRPWPHLDVIQMCAREMFGNFSITEYPFRPRHGNGATREVKRRDADPWHKNRHFRVDGEIINYLRYRLGDPDWASSLYSPYRGLDRTSQLVCVPKSMVKNRTISKEPTTLQFLQQDIMQALDDYFIEHLHDRIDLHDQDRSRYLALMGSADGSYATIDLSCASDSVSVRHLEEIFEGLPVLYPLMATRSHFVQVMDKSGSIATRIETRKFAPMGSAVCFPVECMVFAILCEAAVRLEVGRRSRSFDYVVYGDDIVIRTRYAPRLIELLNEFGFVVNRDKSFTDDDGVRHHFREACGIEAMDGEDVTPLRLSRRLVSPTKNDSDRQAGLGVGLIDLLNRSYLKGFYFLHRWINDVLSEHHWYRRLLRVSITNYRRFSDQIRNNERPWVVVGTPFVITDDSHDTQWSSYGMRSVPHSPIHQTEAKVATAATRRRHEPRDGNDLFTWFVEQEQLSSAVVFTTDATGVVTIRPRDLKWSKTWVPLVFGTPSTIRLHPTD
jgi:hypothetical protein